MNCGIRFATFSAVNGSGFSPNGISLDFRLVRKRPIASNSCRWLIDEIFSFACSERPYVACIVFPNRFFSFFFPLGTCKQYASMHKTLHFSPYSVPHERHESKWWSMCVRVRYASMRIGVQMKQIEGKPTIYIDIRTLECEHKLPASRSL